jgi:adenylosuccinate lyase
MSREESYLAVQRNAMKVWERPPAARDGAFLELLGQDAEVGRHLDAAALESLFDLDFHTRHVDTIFERVFGSA